VNRVLRYWKLWRTLPADERRMRTGRLVERLLRQDPSMRSLGLAPDPPSEKRFARALQVPVARMIAGLREAGPERGPLFGGLASRAAGVAANHPDHVRAVLEASGPILEGRFDLLGSGERHLADDRGRIDWHRDWKSGLDWDSGTFHTDLAVVRGDGSDVKVPWELSRFHHLLTLGQAYLLAPHALARLDATRLRERCAATARSRIDDWIRANPRGLGVNWTCTMEVAMRAATWLAVLGMLRRAPAFDDAFLLRVTRSLWSHGRHIRRHLEIGGDGWASNHYLADVAGLYAIACGLPELREADRWRRLARRALEDEMGRQVHSDGVDFERSLPYHRLVGEIFVHAAVLGRNRDAAFPPAWLDRLARMLEFTATATRDDHTVAQWGDNDDGRWLPLHGYGSADPHDHRHLMALGGRLLDRDDLAAAGAGAEVEADWLLGAPARAARSESAGRSSRGFGDAGYYVMRDRDLHCGISCGAVGTRGLGNHSHNDVLAVCVWAGGVEWIADPGTGSYTGDPGLRDRMRATAAHATLQLGRREQNRPGEGLDGLFRLHERAEPQLTAWQAEADAAYLDARHRGFSSPDETWVHARSVEFDPRARRWLVRDLLTRETGDRPPEEAIFLRYPLGPGVGCERVAACPSPLDDLLAARAEREGAGGSRDRFALRLTADPGSTFWIALDLPAGSRLEVADGLYSPRYGVTRPASVATATLPASAWSLALSVLWSPEPS